MSLRDMLVSAAQKYYTDGTSEMTDEEFDAGLKKLAEENPNDPIITAVGHGYSIDLDSTDGEKVPHKYQAGSLPKCYDFNTFQKGFKDTYAAKVCALKFDGISVVLYYDKGELSRAVTRGDGFTGIDITSKILTIKPEWKKIPDYSFSGVIRGEILMRTGKFEEYKAAHPDAKNPRNTTAGLINGKYISDEDLRYLDIILYTIIGGVGATADIFRIYTSTLWWLAQNFGKESVAEHSMLLPSTEENFVSIMKQLCEQFKQDFPYDGIVITNWHLRYDEVTFGVTYESIAFKFEAESAETVVKAVEWNLSKTKYLVPKINVEPISLSGTTVQYATGFNAEFIYKYKIKPGKRVIMLKSNEIIPIVTKVFDEETNEWIGCSERYQ